MSVLVFTQLYKNAIAIFVHRLDELSVPTIISKMEQYDYAQMQMEPSITA